MTTSSLSRRRVLGGVVATIGAVLFAGETKRAFAAGSAAPSGVLASPGNGTATVIWTAPASPPAAVSSYTVTILDTAGNPIDPPAPVTTANGAVTTATISGLTNGTAYEFSVTANYPDSTAVSDPSTAITVGAPVVPSAVAAFPGDGIADVTWAVPADNGTPIATYQVTIYQGSTTVTTLVSATPAVSVSGLANGTAYTAGVTATNANGTSPQGVSAPFTPAGLPDAPGAVTAVPGDGSVTVTWTASSPNGSTITNYRVAIYQGTTPVTAVDSATTTATVSGLANGTEYTASVTAISGVGTSTASVSSPFTPTAAGTSKSG